MAALISMLAVSGCSAGLTAPPAVAQCQQRVLIAVDDSGSTFPNPATAYPGTDPSNLRGRAAVSAADFLLNNTTCEETIAAVAFGTDVQVISPGFTLALPDTVSAVWLHPKNLNWTNTVAVLQSARILLEGSGTKALLIVTDGYPQMPGVSDSVMRADFAAEARQLTTAGVTINVILLSGKGAATSPAYAAWTPVWERATSTSQGAFEVVQDARQLPGAVDTAVGAIEEQTGSRLGMGHAQRQTPLHITTPYMVASGKPVLFLVTADRPVHVVAVCSGASPVTTFLKSGAGVVVVRHPRPGACSVRVTSSGPPADVTVGTATPQVAALGPTAGAQTSLTHGRRSLEVLLASLLALALGLGLYRFAVGGVVLVPAQLSQDGRVLMNLQGLPRSGWRRLRSRWMTLLGDRSGADFGVVYAPPGAWLAVRRQGPGRLAVRGARVRLPSGEHAHRWTAVPPVAELLLGGVSGEDETRYTLELLESERGLNG